MTALGVSLRILLSILLLLSVVPLAFSPKVNSQQFTTATILLTTITTATSSSARTVTSAQTTGFTWSFTVTARLGTGRYSCEVGFVPFPFNITRSQTIHVDYSSDLPTDFALFNAPTFTAWMMQPYPCNFMLGFSKSGITSGSFDIPLSAGPSENPYWFVFIHSGSGIWPKIQIAVNGVLLQNPVTLASTHIITGTKILTSYQTLQVPFLQANASWLVPVVLVAIVIVLLLVTWKSSWKPRKRLWIIGTK